jgi:Tfp pilus assembly protein PilX
MTHKERRRFTLVVTVCIFIVLTLLILHVMKSAVSGTVAIGV